MKFVISTTEFTDLVGHICSVVPSRPSIPIISNFMLEARDDEIILTATDLVVGLQCRMPAKVIEAGATTLPGKACHQLLRELTSPHLEVTTSPTEMTELRAGESHFQLHGMASNEFPSAPDLQGSQQLTLKYDQLHEAFYRTSFAVSKEDHRPVLTGVFMRIGDGLATFIGTDGKRLAKSEETIEIDSTIHGEYVLPIKAVDEILRLPCVPDSEITLHLFQDKAAIETDKIIILTKLLQGDYPDVTRVIPDASESTVTLHREELMSLLRQIALFTPDAHHSVKFTLSPGNLRLTANNSKIGNGKVNMPVNYQAKSLQIAFNPNYFLDILRHSKDETVELGVTDAYNPGIIKDSSKALCVLMPMRLNED